MPEPQCMSPMRVLASCSNMLSCIRNKKEQWSSTVHAKEIKRHNGLEQYMQNKQKGIMVFNSSCKRNKKVQWSSAENSKQFILQCLAVCSSICPCVWPSIIFFVCHIGHPSICQHSMKGLFDNVCQLQNSKLSMDLEYSEINIYIHFGAKCRQFVVETVYHILTF